MATPNVLRVEIPQQKRAYFPGETISGIVHANPMAPMNCRKLTISMNWSTGGRGNTDAGPKEQVQTLFTGTIQPGMAQQFPFSFVVPNGPLTYHGKLVSVDWYLKAQADLPWATDPSARAEFIIGSPEVPVPLDLGPNYKPPQPPAVQQHTPWWAIAIAVVVALVISWFINFWCCMAVAIPLTLAWAIPTYFKFLQVKKLGNRVLDIDPLQAYAGDPIAVTFNYHPRNAVKVEYISASLSGGEVASSGSGSTRETHKHELHSGELFMVRDVTTVPGLPAMHRVELLLPAKAAPTVVSGHNSVEWKVLFNIKMPGYGVWTETYSITVWPTPGQEQFIPEDWGDEDDDDDDDDDIK